MITIQNYVRVQSLEEAYELNQKRSNRILGGMLWLKTGNGTVQTAIDLSDLMLHTIDEDSEAFSIGSMVTLRQLEQHAGLKLYSQNTISVALQDIVGVQFRNMATIGGSVWGRFGFSDVLTILLAMDSYVELYKGGIIPLEEFSKMPYDNDILIRVIVKKTPGRFSYRTVRAQRTDFPVIACALSELGGKFRAVTGARPGRAMIVRDSHGLLNGHLTHKKAESFSEYVAANTPTGSNLRGSATYRSHLVKVLTERNVLELGGQIC